ncbi:MAG: STAND family AAA ATPase [Sphingobacterium sp.]
MGSAARFQGVFVQIGRIYPWGDLFQLPVENYLREVGFHFDAQVIIEYLFERKIFVKSFDNHVRFPHNCFFHFFTAKRMEYDKKFEEYILDESRYFTYPKQIALQWTSRGEGLKSNKEEVKTLNRYFECTRKKITQMQIHFQFQQSEETGNLSHNICINGNIAPMSAQ